ncbi:hypothetical protein D031_3695A, partial [Vibrio parahaemolyticus VP-48]
MHANGRWGC